LSPLLRRARKGFEVARQTGIWLPLQVITVAACVPLLMRLPLRRVGRVIEPRRPPEVPAEPEQVEQLVRLMATILWSGRPLIQRGCLTRGITHYYFLRRAGVPLELCFGMGKPFGSTAGHCWLIRNGEPYLEPVDPRTRYTEVCRIPGLAEPHVTTLPRPGRQ
jgi:hypothetical protein